jgi:hypothetical protein
MSYGNVQRKAKRRSWVVALVLGLLATSCGGPKRGEDDVTPTTIKIDRLEPSSTGITVPFNVRADGQAVLAVFGTDLPAEAAVFWNDQQLETSRGGDFFAAVVPSNLYQLPGAISVTVRSTIDIRSNPLEFRIYDKTGPAPKIVQLDPNATNVGKGFHIQSDGRSAVGVAGEDFLPGVTLVSDGQKLNTVFGSGTMISAIVPDKLIATAGSHRMWAINPDGKISNKVLFSVATH